MGDKACGRQGCGRQGFWETSLWALGNKASGRQASTPFPRDPQKVTYAICDDDEECGVMQKSDVLRYGLGVRAKQGCKLGRAQTKFKNMDCVAKEERGNSITVEFPNFTPKSRGGQRTAVFTAEQLERLRPEPRPDPRSVAAVRASGVVLEGGSSHAAMREPAGDRRAQRGRNRQNEGAVARREDRIARHCTVATRIAAPQPAAAAASSTADSSGANSRPEDVDCGVDVTEEMHVSHQLSDRHRAVVRTTQIRWRIEGVEKSKGRLQQDRRDAIARARCTLRTVAARVAAPQPAAAAASSAADSSGTNSRPEDDDGGVDATEEMHVSHQLSDRHRAVVGTTESRWRVEDVEKSKGRRQQEKREATAQATLTLRDFHSCLPGYSLGALIASGSFGWVFHAKQTESEARAAIKIFCNFEMDQQRGKRTEQLLSHRGRAHAQTGAPPQHRRPPWLHVCEWNGSFAGALVLEYAHLGDLSGRIVDMHRRGVDASVHKSAQRYFKHLARAIRHTITSRTWT